MNDGCIRMILSKVALFIKNILNAKTDIVFIKVLQSIKVTGKKEE